TSSYSGYTASPASLKCSRRYAVTRGDAPIVFSLKSSRNLFTRPPVGGLYGAMFSTASRGCSTPGGKSIFLLAKAHLHRPGMRFQPFGPRQGRDGGSQLAQRIDRELLHR